jgi:RsiW-degrading membrane proteinase PrsW (M82 family)
VRRFDRAHPEPWWLVGATFALGCLSVIPAAVAEIGWSRASEWFDPSLVTMGGEALSLPLALPVFAVVIGLSEEGSKFLGAWGLAFHRREFDEPIDGIVYGAASSLGFAAVENVKYFAVGRLTPSLVAVRMFMSVPAHLFFGAIWGFALGRKLIFPKTRVLGYLALAAILHGAFDAFLSVSSFAVLSLVLNLTLATLFILLLRHSLRHGVVTPAVAGADSLRRALYPVGSTAGFVFSIFALYSLAAALFVSSAYAGGADGALGPTFLTTMSALVVALGGAAYAFTATMPLDVVLDDYGVTFAGTARAWRTIHAIQPARRGLRLRSSDGDLWLGPARPAEVTALAQAIAHRVAAVRLPA